MNRMRRLLCVFILCAPVFAQATPLPTVEGESLAGSKVVLPDAAKGKVAILIFGFTKASKESTKAWADRIRGDFGTQSGFTLYDLPVLESVPGFIRGMVISSMKEGVPENQRDHFVPILKNESDLKKLVSYKESDDAYLVLLDTTGQIVGRKHGPFSDPMYAQLRADIQSQLSKK